MSDLKGFGIWIGAVFLRIVMFFPAVFQGVKISIQKKRLGDYFWSLGSGIDIWGNKLIAPHANKHWVKPGGRQYGMNEHISLTMAINKHYGHNTKYADRWERVINKVDKDHLAKTLKSYAKEN